MKIKPDLYLKGVFMGIAEIIPGVSGGTIAFITGIYEELINSIKSINTNTLKLLITFKFSAFWRAVNGTFLITLIFGMLTSILVFSRFIVYLLDDHPFKIWGFFFGLIIASGILIFYQIQKIGIAVLLSFVIGLSIASYIVLQAPSITPNTNFFIFLSGAIAISAMILPGISVVGLVTFSRVFSYLFKKYSDVVISVLIGFLGGSLFKIWPFYEVLEYNSSNEPIYTTPILPTANQSNDLIFFLTFVVIGLISMWVLEKKFIGLNKEI